MIQKGIITSMKLIKKKSIAYTIIFVGQIIITLIVSQITGVETTNTWLGTLYANIFCLTIIIMLFDIEKSVKISRPLMGYVFRFCYLLMILIISIINIILLVNIFI